MQVVSLSMQASRNTFKFDICRWWGTIVVGIMQNLTELATIIDALNVG